MKKIVLDVINNAGGRSFKHITTEVIEIEIKKVTGAKFDKMEVLEVAAGKDRIVVDLEKSFYYNFEEESPQEWGRKIMEYYMAGDGLVIVVTNGMVRALTPETYTKGGADD